MSARLFLLSATLLAVDAFAPMAPRGQVALPLRAATTRTTTPIAGPFDFINEVSRRRVSMLARGC